MKTLSMTCALRALRYAYCRRCSNRQHAKHINICLNQVSKKEEFFFIIRNARNVCHSLIDTHNVLRSLQKQNSFTQGQDAASGKGAHTISCPTLHPCCPLHQNVSVCVTRLLLCSETARLCPSGSKGRGWGAKRQQDKQMRHFDCGGDFKLRDEPRSEHACFCHALNTGEHTYCAAELLHTVNLEANVHLLWYFRLYHKKAVNSCKVIYFWKYLENKHPKSLTCIVFNPTSFMSLSYIKAKSVECTTAPPEYHPLAAFWINALICKILIKLFTTKLTIFNCISVTES